MKLTEIQELIRFVSKSGVNEVEIEQKDFKISIKSDNPPKRRGAKANLPQPEQVFVQQQTAIPHYQAVVPPVNDPAPMPTIAEIAKPEPEEDNYITIKAQMIGTFYRRANPEAEPFVEVGSTIKVGDEICIIEAMKLYNKIESEVAGKVVKVLVEDSTPVEFDQPLFLVEPV